MNPLFTFRVLIESVVIDEQSGSLAFVARCLETGSVVTADSVEEAESMIKELLIDEVKSAVANNNLANLFNCPFGMPIWLRYWKACRPISGTFAVSFYTFVVFEEVSAEIRIVRNA